VTGFWDPEEAARKAEGELGAETDGAPLAQLAPELTAWTERLETAFDALAAYLEHLHPCWKTSKAECRSLAAAWAPVAAEAAGGAAVPPIYLAAGLTAIWALPRTVTTYRAKRDAQTSSGESVFGGAGEWQDDPAGF
jgi:hypothetical protein